MLVQNARVSVVNAGCDERYRRECARRDGETECTVRPSTHRAAVERWMNEEKCIGRKNGGEKESALKWMAKRGAK